MAKKYFEQFPKISYNGYQVRNLTTSAKLANKYINLPYSFQLYEVAEEERADNVAHNLYDDQYLTWMLYYANRVIDPYYDWHLSDNQIYELILKKYGTLEYANRKISHFRSNWYNDNRQLEPASFEAMFGDYTTPHSSYWDPLYTDDSRRVIYFHRKESSMSVNTNKLTKVQVSNTSFSTGDLVIAKSGADTVANAEVEAVGNTYLHLKNVLGELSNGVIIQSYDSTGPAANVTLHLSSSNTQANSWTITNISDEEYVYWTPVTYYDIEKERNEANRIIKTVDGPMAIKVADRLEDELRGKS